MNKTKIEWADYTWNPIVGCDNGCNYCYAKKISMRFIGNFIPTFHPERLDEPSKVKKPSLIFADSMSDFWSSGVKQEWRNEIYRTMSNNRQHTFLVLTKNPNMITETDKENIPENVWIGVSVTRFDDRWRVGSLIARTRSGQKTFVSLEPILDDIISSYTFLVNWIIVGCLTGVKNAFRPKDSTIKEIYKELNGNKLDGCPVCNPMDNDIDSFGRTYQNSNLLPQAVKTHETISSFFEMINGREKIVNDEFNKYVKSRKFLDLGLKRILRTDVSQKKLNFGS